MSLRVIHDGPWLLGEAPHWDAATSTLYWVDIAGRLVLAWREGEAQPRRWRTPEPVSAAIPCRDGRLLLTLASGTALLDPSSGALVRWRALESPELGNRANEARCDAHGRLWVATMQNNLGPDGEGIPVTCASGALHSLDGGGLAQSWVSGVGIGNTLAWSPDGRTLYFADSLANRIDAWTFDVERGALRDRRPFVDGGPGEPDGSAVDAEGCLWNARWGAGRLIRYRPDGRVEREVPLPVRQPSSCVFGGPELRTLYITSARIGLAQAAPVDGALLALDVDVPGLPGHGFAGPDPLP